MKLKIGTATYSKANRKQAAVLIKAVIARNTIHNIDMKSLLTMCFQGLTGSVCIK